MIVVSGCYQNYLNGGNEKSIVDIGRGGGVKNALGVTENFYV
jgi:hypothetical protein